MTSPMSVMFLFLCLITGTQSLIVDPQPITAPAEILNFVDTIIGGYDNSAQICTGSSQYDRIQATLIPIVLNYPGFSGKPLVYFELAVNGHLVLAHICIVGVDTFSKGVLTLIPFNFTDTSKFRFGQIQITDLPYLLKHNSPTNDPACIIRFSDLGDGTYSATWPDCRSVINGLHPAYTVTLTCEVFTSTVPLFSRERTTTSPYVFIKIASGFPIPYLPPYFKSFCQLRREACLSPIGG